MPGRPLLALGAAALAAGIAALAGPQGGAVPAPAAVETGRYSWRIADPRFGGFSGLDLAPDGQGFTAVSDRGTLATGRLLRDAQGRIAGVEAAVLHPLRDNAGAPLARAWVDAEGLAVAPDGRILVSFEVRHRVWAYDVPGAPARPLPPHPDFDRLQVNSGLEALAVDAQGRILTLPERSGRLDRPFPVYRFAQGRWTRPFELPRDGPYLPVGMDIGPDGRLYLLERNFRGLRGFDLRISRFALEGDRPSPREVLVETRAPFQNNFEGISAWAGPDGAIRLTLISDDNFAFPLTTEFVEYRIPP